MNISDLSDGLQHLGLPVTDLEGTISYYEKLGFQVIHRTEVPDTKEKVAFIRLGNLVVECYENESIAGVPGAINHMAINVSDVEAAYQFINEAGLNNTGDSIQFLPFFENGVKCFIINGPNGERIEFNQYL